MKKVLFVLILIGIISCQKEQGSVQETLNGSYAHIVVVNDYLYAINSSELVSFNISVPEKPVEIDRKKFDVEIENVFHSNGILFVGSQANLFIYEIQDNGVPKLKSDNDYFISDGITACDPVISSGKYAYVTLSSSYGRLRTNCVTRSTLFNELRIYDISNTENPILLSRLELSYPKGLAIDGNILFVCEEQDGVKVIDVENPKNPVILHSLGKFVSYDVIAKEGVLMVVGPDQIRQYDYTDIENISFLSSILF